MRRSMKAIVVVLLLTFTLSLTACGNDTKKLQGVWKHDESTNSTYSAVLASFGELMLENDGTYKRVGNRAYIGLPDATSSKGTYKVSSKDKTISFYPDESNQFSGNGLTYSYSIEGKNLTITDTKNGGSVTLTKHG